VDSKKIVSVNMGHCSHA